MNGEFEMAAHQTSFLFFLSRHEGALLLTVAAQPLVADVCGPTMACGHGCNPGVSPLLHRVCLRVLLRDRSDRTCVPRPVDNALGKSATVFTRFSLHA